MTAAEGFRRDPAATREHSSLENRTTVPLTVSQTSADESSCTHTSICSFFYYCKDKKRRKKGSGSSLASFPAVRFQDNRCWNHVKDSCSSSAGGEMHGRDSARPAQDA
jgi:hypothetical protein